MPVKFLTKGSRFGILPESSRTIPVAEGMVVAFHAGTLASETDPPGEHAAIAKVPAPMTRTAARRHVEG
ncbi:hypothetical protein GCM10023063_03390 [Arthrobacter methylotrophus]